MIGVGAQRNTIAVLCAEHGRETPTCRDSTKGTVCANDNGSTIGNTTATLLHLQHVQLPGGVPVDLL